MVKVKGYDILKEVGNICSGNATIALAELLKTQISLEVPSLEKISLADVHKRLGGEGKIIIAVHTKILAGLKGDIVLVFTEDSAFRLIDIFMKSLDRKSTGILTEMGMSLIKEVGNIVISSYLGVLGMMLQTPVVPSIPTLTSGPAEQIFRFVFQHEVKMEENLVLINVLFKSDVHSIGGGFYMALNAKSADLIVKSLSAKQ